MEQILQLEQRLLEAIKTSNVEVLDQLLHDDLLFIAPNSQTITKEMDLASHRKGEMVVEAIESEVEHLQLVGNTAIVVIVYHTKGKMLGKDIEGSFKYIRFWQREDDYWKVIGGSCMQL
ncbi:MAG TPA: nuclear transport factor 2 family protein [Fluviicola sp.]|nr:nuclear transport factor 2 family protein [Fluviicola sp.]